MREFSDDEVKEELKRVDHLIYVTLKYTKTGDVIRNIIKRMISTLDLAIIEALENSKKIKELPPSPIQKVNELKKIHKDSDDLISFYLLLKNIIKSEYEVKEQYRKHMTLITPYKKVDVETLKEFHQKTINFVKYLRGEEID
ncbi:hypothetical protein CL618_01480 [archaeon]|nr:hypothetical protein [archaeon]